MDANRIVRIALTSLAVALPALSGLMKFMGGEEIESSLQQSGVAPYRFLLGTMEIVFAALFLYPKTMKLGFILLSCYFAGALATELSHAAPLNALFLLVLIWVAAFVRDRTIFLPAS